jgi:hypothetical protein
MNRPQNLQNALFATLFVVCLIGCGAAELNVGAPWNPEDTPFFDDGADLIENPAALAGTWGGRQKNLMEGRVQLADVVALVEIQAVQTDMDADTVRGKRIDVRVTSSWYGTPPSDRMSLQSLIDTPGYELIVRYEKRLVGNYILFFRNFAVDEKGSTRTAGHHFHLSPASKELTEYVKQRLAARKEAEDG